MSYLDKNILLTITQLIHMSVWTIMIYVTFYHPEFNILYVLFPSYMLKIISHYV
jgi:hypothetical protein